jgi:pimeloyl-ACP methyl ester carboxylesterase
MVSEPREHSFLGLGPHGFHRVAYVEWGARENPRVLVCVHGLTRNGRDFDFLARALAQDFRVVCPDIAGRGRSDWLTHAQDYAYAQYCADMNALIARLDVEQVDWVGTSMGGLIGMMLAAQPNAVTGKLAQPNSLIRKLVMNDVGPFIPQAALERLAQYVGKAPSFSGIASVEAYLRETLAGFGALSPEQWAHLAQYSAVNKTASELRLHYDPSIGQAFAGPLRDVALWPLWQALRSPTLVLRGAQSDLLLAGTLQQMLATRPGTQSVEFADAGHAPALMAQEQIDAVRAFLLA